MIRMLCTCYNVLQTVVTCMTTINKTHNDEGAASCLVVGTENKTVYILDPAAFTYLTRVSITIRIEMHYN